MWPVATLLDDTDIEHFHHGRRFHWTMLVWDFTSLLPPPVLIFQLLLCVSLLLMSLWGQKEKETCQFLLLVWMNQLQLLDKMR